MPKIIYSSVIRKWFGCIALIKAYMQELIGLIIRTLIKVFSFM